MHERQRQVINALKYAIKWPYRAARRAGINRRLPSLNRGWRTAIPPTLHISIMRGLFDYKYRDIPMQKHPMEMALYTRLIWEAKPRTIIEIGSLSGGSAVWMADMLEVFGIDGEVVSIDITPPSPPYKPTNVTF
jgi:cephalosporin hydroxylase